LFANNATHAAFCEFAVCGQRKRGIAVGRYVLMPNHIHLFVCGPPQFDLAQWVRMLKVTLGKELAQLGHQPEFWQRGFFDHLLRRAESYAEKWAYVRENPVRAGLVAKAKDWPYQGEIVAIDRV
jgi:REP element-mobilizing transposase RayT